MKRKTLFFLLGLLLIIPLSIHAYDFQSGDLYYNITSNKAPYTVEVTYVVFSISDNYPGLTTAIIPERVIYNGITYSVTSIGERAFFYCSGLTSITIPNTVTSIGYGAFSNCWGLTSITIPESVASIGDAAFNFCSNLTSVTIPNSVTSIGYRSFAFCFGLTSVTIPESVTSIGDEAFYDVLNLIYNGPVAGAPWGALSVNGYMEGNLIYESEAKTCLLGCVRTATGDTTIPESVTSIGRNAFSYCSGLTAVTIPNSVTSIGSEAFSNCSGLTSVAIPNSVTSIESLTFSNCLGLTSATIPNSVATIGEWAFSGCSGLTSVFIPHSVTTIGGYAFAYCSGLMSITSYAMTPPSCSLWVFAGVVLEDVMMSIPCAALDDYKQADVWREFKNFQCIGSEEVELSGNTIAVVPSSSEVTITWPKVDNAYTYTLVITKDGVVFCTLTFNANGQLMGIAFVPSKDRNNARAPQAAQTTVNGWQFTVTGLNESSNYAYTMTVMDNKGTELRTYNGTFRTLGTTALDNVNSADDVPVRKIIRHGQVFVLRGNGIYTILGEKVE